MTRVLYLKSLANIFYTMVEPKALGWPNVFLLLQASVRCDNIRDCDRGEDEVDCYALSNSVLEPKAYGGQDSG